MKIILTSLVVLLMNATSPSMGAPARALRSLDQGVAWLNSAPLSPAELRGKVVLVDFWTYTCINWRRTLPYLRAWSEKYRDQGLVVVGVHTPEFSFEKDVAKVRRAAGEQHVDYPIVVDSDYAIWNAFDNHYWPALYFIDSQGRIRHHQFGEGEYEKLEGVIQQLLAEAGQDSFERRFATIEGRGAEAAADWNNMKSPETYLGYERSGTSVLPDGWLPNRARDYRRPSRLKLNQWALAGNWTLKAEFAALNQGNGRIAYRFHARDLHLVMSSGARGTPIRFRVSIDGQPPQSSHGTDIDAEGQGVIDEPRMYHLIRQGSPIEEHAFEIEFLEPGAEVYNFTFG